MILVDARITAAPVNTHTHVAADITDFATEVAALAGAHTHVAADITDFETEVNALVGAHTHVVANITDFETEVNALVGSATIAQSQVTDLATDLADKAPLADPVFAGVPVLPGYDLASLPTSVVGGVIFVSDANTGVGTIAFGNGTDWIDINTGVVVA